MNRVSDGSVALDAQDMAFIVDWLAQQFLEPADVQRIQMARSIQGQAALRWIGTVLEQQQASETICGLLSSGTVEQAAATLQHRHAALFDGSAHHNGLPPYASVWDGTGRLFGAAVQRMHSLLRTLDVRLAPGCNEPSDHIAIELATLAEALRQGRTDVIQALLNDMRGWTPRFATALAQADGDGLHGNAAKLLAALVDQLSRGYPGMAGQQAATELSPT